MKSFLVGLQFLTRIHISKQTEWQEKNFGESVKWFPLIGWIIGLFLCGIYFFMEPLHAPMLTAFFLVMADLLITGATLADGLMDSADGLFSGRTKERSLAIMKDSLTGAFGVLSILIFVLLKTFSLASIDSDMYLLLVAMPTIGRLILVISICEYPYARPYGLGKAFAVYRSEYAVPFAFIITILPALYFGWRYLALVGGGLFVGLCLNRWIMKKIGGTTGDTYGFVTEITEACIALLFVFLLKGSTWHI